MTQAMKCSLFARALLTGSPPSWATNHAAGFASRRSLLLSCQGYEPFKVSIRQSEKSRMWSASTSSTRTHSILGSFGANVMPGGTGISKPQRCFASHLARDTQLFSCIALPPAISLCTKTSFPRCSIKVHVDGKLDMESSVHASCPVNSLKFCGIFHPSKTWQSTAFRLMYTVPLEHSGWNFRSRHQTAKQKRHACKLLKPLWET